MADPFRDSWSNHAKFVIWIPTSFSERHGMLRYLHGCQCGPHSVCCGPLFFHKLFPPKATPKTLCFKMFQKDNDFSAGSGKLKVNMGPSVESFSQKLKNHPIRASGIQNSARIPFFTEKCSHGCKDIAIHGMGHNGPHDSSMKDTTETKRFAIHINKAQGCKNLEKMITDLGSLHINL